MKACPQGQHCHRHQAKPLAVILGMDCMHWAPVLVDQYQDQHIFFLALYACKLSNMAIMQGNRHIPYSPAEAQNAVAATSSIEDEEVGVDNLPLTTIFHGATSDTPVAIRYSPKLPTLQFLGHTDELEPPTSPTLSAQCQLHASPERAAARGRRHPYSAHYYPLLYYTFAQCNPLSTFNRGPFYSYEFDGNDHEFGYEFGGGDHEFGYKFNGGKHRFGGYDGDIEWIIGTYLCHHYGGCRRPARTPQPQPLAGVRQMSVTVQLSGVRGKGGLKMVNFKPRKKKLNNS